MPEGKKLVFEIVNMEGINEGTSYNFLLNPQEYTISNPARVNAIQTKGGVFIDDFGPGVGGIVLRGFPKNNFVPKPNNTIHNTALDSFQELRDMIMVEFFNDRMPGQPLNKLLRFLNFTDREYYDTVPHTFSMQRTVAKPLFFFYDIHLIIYRKIGTPNSSLGTGPSPLQLPGAIPGVIAGIPQTPYIPVSDPQVGTGSGGGTGGGF